MLGNFSLNISLNEIFNEKFECVNFKIRVLQKPYKADKSIEYIVN